MTAPNENIGTTQVERKGLAILLRIASGVAATIMIVLVKIASTHGVSPGETMFYRNAFALPVVALWTAMGPGLRSLGTTRPFAHMSRAVLGLTSMVLMFITIGLLPVAEFTAFMFVVPLFATILSALFLGEHVGLHRWAAILVGFAGVVVMTHPGSGGGISMIGMFAGLVTAGMVSIVTITVRQLGATEPPTTTVFWFTAIATLVTSFTLPFFYQSHDLEIWLLILGIGLSGALLQIATTTSLRFAPISATASFDYLQLVWSMLLSWLIWSDFPSSATIGGACLIGGAGLYTVYREHRRQRSTAAEASPIS